MKCPHCGAVFELKRPEDSQNLSSIQETAETEQRVNETDFDHWLNSLPNDLEASRQKTEKIKTLEDHEETPSRQAHSRRVQKTISHILGTKPDHKYAVDRLNEILEKPRGTSASLDDTGM